MISIKSNPHTHTNYCDGSVPPRAMADAAVAKGFTCLGFAGHSYTEFDTRYCMCRRKTTEYIAEINLLKTRYAGQIDLLCGVELDYHSDENPARFDYAIGSSHYVRDEHTGRYYAIDSTPDELSRALHEAFGGSVLALAAQYFANITEMCHQRGVHILGHFDLLRKFLGRHPSISPENPTYRKMAQAALENCVGAGVIVEVNTGGMARGFTATPYPDTWLLRVLSEMGAKVILSSDAHDPSALDFHFAQTAELLKEIGFREIMTLEKRGFVSHPLH